VRPSRLARQRASTPTAHLFPGPYGTAPSTTEAWILRGRRGMVDPRVRTTTSPQAGEVRGDRGGDRLGRPAVGAGDGSLQDRPPL